MTAEHDPAAFNLPPLAEQYRVVAPVKGGVSPLGVGTLLTTDVEATNAMRTANWTQPYAPVPEGAFIVGHIAGMGLQTVSLAFLAPVTSLQLDDALRMARLRVATLELLARRTEVAWLLAYTTGLPRLNAPVFVEEPRLGVSSTYIWTRGDARVEVSAYVPPGETIPCAEDARFWACDIRWAWRWSGVFNKVDVVSFSPDVPDEFKAFVKAHFR